MGDGVKWMSLAALMVSAVSVLAQQPRTPDGVNGLDEQLDARGWRPVSHKNKFGKEYPPTERDRY